eukprot:PhF_6_TR18881/c1_g1_i1/m.27491
MIYFLLILVHVAALEAVSLKSCYLLYSGVDDMGYTYAHNLGRKAAFRSLLASLPATSDVESFYIPNASLVDNPGDLIRDFVAGGCHLIVATSPAFRNATVCAARNYPNVTFALHDAFQHTSTQANLIIYGTRDYEPWFLAGVVAAMETTTRKIAFVAAHVNIPAVVVPINAFRRGVAVIDAAIPVHVVPLGRWEWEQGSYDAAQAVHTAIGVDVIAHYSDAPGVNSYCKTLMEMEGAWNRTTTVFSIGVHTNLADFMGDSVLTSVYSNWGYVYRNISEQMIQNVTNSANRTLWFSMTSGATLAAELSPRARRETLDVMRKYRDFMMSGGLQVFPSISDDVLRNQTTLNQNDYNLIQHKTFIRGRDVCPAGTLFVPMYDAGVRVLAMKCYECPENTFATNSQYGKCRPCPKGLFSSTGAAACTASFDWSRSLEAIIGVVIGLVVLLLLMGSLWRWFGCVRGRGSRGGESGDDIPLESPVPFVVTHMSIVNTGDDFEDPNFSSQVMLEAEYNYRVMINQVKSQYGLLELPSLGSYSVLAGRSAEVLIHFCNEVLQWSREMEDLTYTSASTSPSASNSAEMGNNKRNAKQKEEKVLIDVRMSLHYGKLDEFPKSTKGSNIAPQSNPVADKKLSNVALTTAVCGLRYLHEGQGSGAVASQIFVSELSDCLSSTVLSKFIPIPGAPMFRVMLTSP